MRNGRKDSDLSDIGIIRKIDDLPQLKAQLIEEFDLKSHDHHAISRYSVLLAQHVLTLTGIPADAAMRSAIDINLKWQAGLVKFQAARDVAFELHNLAREEKDPIKVKVYRILAQVAATPHVKRHALIASDYAVTLINRMAPKDMDAVQKEREIQISLMRQA